MNQLDKEITKLETLIDLVNELRNKKFPVVKQNEKWKITITSEKYTYESIANFLWVWWVYLHQVCSWKTYISDKQIDKIINELKKL